MSSESFPAYFGSALSLPAVKKGVGLSRFSTYDSDEVVDGSVWYGGATDDLGFGKVLACTNVA